MAAMGIDKRTAVEALSVCEEKQWSLCDMTASETIKCFSILRDF